MAKDDTTATATNDAESAELVSGLDVSNLDFEEPAESRMHRFRKEDVVALQNEGHNDLDHNDEGIVKGFANAEGTYLIVEFSPTDGDDSDKGTHILTEDEVRRVA